MSVKRLKVSCNQKPWLHPFQNYIDKENTQYSKAANKSVEYALQTVKKIRIKPTESRPRIMLISGVQTRSSIP